MTRVEAQRFLHCTYNDRTAICDGRILVDREQMTDEEWHLPLCHQCVRLNDHFMRERRRRRSIGGSK